MLRWPGSHKLSAVGLGRTAGSEGSCSVAAQRQSSAEEGAAMALVLRRPTELSESGEIRARAQNTDHSALDDVPSVSEFSALCFFVTLRRITSLCALGFRLCRHSAAKKSDQNQVASRNSHAVSRQKEKNVHFAASVE